MFRSCAWTVQTNNYRAGASLLKPSCTQCGYSEPIQMQCMQILAFQLLRGLSYPQASVEEHPMKNDAMLKSIGRRHHTSTLQYSEKAWIIMYRGCPTVSSQYRTTQRGKAVIRVRVTRFVVIVQCISIQQRSFSVMHNAHLELGCLRDRE